MDAWLLESPITAIKLRTPARSAWSGQDVAGWLNAGATAELVLDVVRQVRGRAKQPPGSLRYFDKAIRFAIAERRSAPPAAGPAAPSARPSPIVAWTKAFQAHCDAGGRPGAFPAFEAWSAQHAA